MSSTPLPTAIVAPVDAFVQDLAAWAAAHRDASFAVLEQELTSRLRTLAPQLLGGLITVTQRSLDPRLTRDHPRCPACDALGRLRGWRDRQVATTWGPVRWERPCAQCPACGHTWSPTDQTLELVGQQRHSPALRDWITRLGSTVPFREAAHLLTFLTGVHVGAETIRTHTEAVGTALDAAERVAAVTVATTRQPAGPVDPAPHQLVAEIDGVMVRFLDGWGEVKLGVVGAGIRRRRTRPATCGPSRMWPRMPPPRTSPHAGARRSPAGEGSRRSPMRDRSPGRG